MVNAEACQACGQPAQAGQRFCGGCGRSLSRTCAGCGADNPPGFRFCGGCGEELGLTAAAAPTTPEREERRWATVLFADLSGFTRFSESADPEEVRALADRCGNLMASIVERHGGWFDKLMGDGMLAVFGADVAHGDDAERAVRSALELRRASEEESDAFGGLRLSIGVNTGEVMYAAVGPGIRRAQTVMGDAVNTAARLQAAAAPGVILVGEETWRATRSAITYEEASPVAAKGKAEPVAVWAALAATELGAGRAVSSVPLIGRDHELALLQSAWERAAAERRPQLVTVLGDAGVGKTKLAGALADIVAAGGGRVARGRSLPYGESTGYGAFALAIKDVLGLQRSDDVDAVHRAVRRRVAHLAQAAEAEELASNIATLLGVGAASGADKQNLFLSARRFVEAVVHDVPTMIVFEDIHWADPTLLELIESIATRCRDVPLLLLTLARPELLDRAQRWGSVGSYSAVTLEPLRDRDAERLACLHLGVDEGSPSAARLVEVCGGNPLFIEEAGASVVERATDVTSELPTNVRTIIAARIDALSPAERAVLLDAAVIGKVFWRGPLAHMGHADVDDVLDALDRRDVIQRAARSQFEGDVEFTFRHMLIREVAYATVPKATRQRSHAATARFIEEVAADRAVELSSTLAHHWREAGDTDRAVDYLLAAAERAGSAWAAHEAIQLYTDALDLLDDEDRRLRVVFARGMLLAQSAFYAEASADLDAALPHLTGRERAEALVARGSASVWLMDGDRARRCGAEALEIVGDDDELTGPALSVIANGGAMDGRLAVARGLQRRSLESWKPGARTRQLADHLAMMSLTSYWAGAHDDAIDEGRRSYELALAHESATALLQGGSHLAMALTGRGQHEEAIELFEKIAAHGEELEAQPRLTSRTMNMMATALREVGDDDEARACNELGIEYAAAANFGAALSQGRIDLLFADLTAGEIGRAELAHVQITHDVEALAGWHQWLGRGRLTLAQAEISLAKGEPGVAADAAVAAREHARHVGRVKYEALACDALARAMHALGRLEDARAAALAAVAASDRLGHPPTTWRTRATLAHVLSAAGDRTGAVDAARGAREVLHAFGQRLTTLRREQLLAAPSTSSVVHALDLIDPA